MSEKKRRTTPGVIIVSFGDNHIYCGGNACPEGVQDCEECPLLEAHRRAEELIRRISGKE